MNIFDLIVKTEKPELLLEDILFSPENKRSLHQLVKEHHYIEELQRYNLPVDNKLLLTGHSGCGKTTTAMAIAHALRKKLVMLNLGTFISSRLGETSANLKAVFDKAVRDKAVLFLDEFDQVGTMRKSQDRDAASGEMRRLVNTLIQLIDQFPSGSLLIGATNYPELLDHAITRRFQLKLKYEMPGNGQLDEYYDKLLLPFPVEFHHVDREYGISYAEARDLINTAMKRQIICQLEEKQSRKTEREAYTSEKSLTS